MSSTELLKTSGQAGEPGGVSTEMPDLTADRDSDSRNMFFFLFSILFSFLCPLL